MPAEKGTWQSIVDYVSSNNSMQVATNKKANDIVEAVKLENQIVRSALLSLKNQFGLISSTADATTKAELDNLVAHLLDNIKQLYIPREWAALKRAESYYAAENLAIPDSISAQIKVLEGKIDLSRFTDAAIFNAWIAPFTEKYDESTDWGKNSETFIIEHISKALAFEIKHTVDPADKLAKQNAAKYFELIKIATTMISKYTDKALASDEIVTIPIDLELVNSANTAAFKKTMTKNYEVAPDTDDKTQMQDDIDKFNRMTKNQIGERSLNIFATVNANLTAENQKNRETIAALEAGEGKVDVNAAAAKASNFWTAMINGIVAVLVALTAMYLAKNTSFVRNTQSNVPSAGASNRALRRGDVVCYYRDPPEGTQGLKWRITEETDTAFTISALTKQGTDRVRPLAIATIQKSDLSKIGYCTS